MCGDHRLAQTDSSVTTGDFGVGEDMKTSCFKVLASLLQ